MPALLAALLVAPLTAGVVLEVSPAGPYTQIWAAVNAANDGDLVLVHAGTYGSFTVQAKSLAVVADSNQIVNVSGTATVHALAAGQTASLIGLRVLGDLGFQAVANLGRVRCERCTFSSQGFDGNAALILSSSDVSFVACALTGSSNSYHGGSGALAEDSTLTFFETSVHGGDGATSTFDSLPSGNGGPGLRAANCTIFSSHSSFVGGAGGDGSWGWPITIGPDPGIGGIGVELEPVSLMRHIDSVLTGGLDGDGYPEPGTWGGTFTVLPGTRRNMTVPNPVRELTSLGFAFHGAPGENVYLLVGLETALQWDPAHKANFLLASPFRTLPVGTTNGSGDLTVNLPLSDLGSGVEFEMFYLQPLFVGPGGAQQLGTPITLAALDQAF